MTPNGQNHYEDWELFALGAVEAQEQREMTAHLASGCESCARDYLAAQAVVAGLATMSPEENLPAGSEARMRERLGFVRESAGTPALESPRRKFWSILPWALAAACLVAVVGLSVGLLRMKSDLEDVRQRNVANEPRSPQQPPTSPNPHNGVTAEQVADLQKTIEGLRQELQATKAAKAQADQEVKDAKASLAEAQDHVKALNASLKDAEGRRLKAEEELSGAHLQLAKAEADQIRLSRRSAQNDQILTVLDSAGLSQLDLKPTGSAQASARVFWQDDRGLLLVAQNLPPLSAEGSYQLWFYQKGTPSVVNVGVVEMDRGDTGLLFVPPGPALLGMTGALLTEEPKTTSASSPGKEILKVKP